MSCCVRVRHKRSWVPRSPDQNTWSNTLNRVTAGRAQQQAYLPLCDRWLILWPLSSTKDHFRKNICLWLKSRLLLVCFGLVQPDTADEGTHHARDHDGESDPARVHFLSLQNNNNILLSTFNIFVLRNAVGGDLQDSVRWSCGWEVYRRHKNSQRSTLRKDRQTR